MKKQLILIIGILIVVNLSWITITRAETLYVGSGKQYTTIQNAISKANEGDTIIVLSGTYYENIKINKQIELEGIDYPIINGNGQTVIEIYTNGCTIKGFNITGGGSWPSWPAPGIYIKSNDNRIEKNIIHHNRVGICLSGADNNIITSNYIYSNDNDGIILGEGDHSSSNNNTLLKNNISSNGEYGIEIRESSYNIIRMNTISKNGYESSYGGTGIYLCYSSNNHIYLNNFENNYQDIYPYASTDFWNSSETLPYKYQSKSYNNYLGNYWKRYIGSDANDDGIGDSSHTISGKTIQDNYPLCYRWENSKYQFTLNDDTSPVTLDMTKTPVSASFDKHLLDIIDQYAGSYYNSNWNLDINQYKAWILTIAWGEGGKGGYVAHSQGALGSDLFYHRATNVGNKFTFSTGLGPFQLDNGGYDHWELWCTIDKLDPEKAVKTILNQHYKKYGDGKTLWDFSNSSSWLSVNPNYFNRAKILWNQVTGTDWDTYKRGKTDLDWSSIKNGLIANAKNNPIYEYDENIKNVGKVKWNITSNDNIKTDPPQAKTVIFDNYYGTWLITARSGSGNKLFDYYYTKDPEQNIELWVWNNSGDTSNKLKYIYVRDNSTGQYPENRTADKLSAGHILSHAALDPSNKLIEQGPSSNGPITPGFELIIIIGAIALVMFWKRKRRDRD